MNRKSTVRDSFIRAFFFSVFLLIFQQTDLRAQVNFINAGTLISSEHATNPNNATLYDNSFTTLNSYGGIAVGIGQYSGKIELEFPTTVPAGKTTFVRIDFDQDVLNALVGGNLGSGLADLLGTVVLGNHYFTVTAKSGTTTVSSYSSQNNFGNEAGRLIRDASGNFYFAITPNLPYNRIEIADNTNALLLGTSNSMRVYYAVHTEGTDSCLAPFATSFDGSGGTVDLLGLGTAEVENPERAIDADVNSYSQVSLGVLSVAGTISQTVYFNALSKPTDQAHITMRLDNPAILNLGLADGLKIEALNGGTVVFTLDAGNLLDLDLLGLLSAGQKATIPITPGQSFDRVKITLSSLVQLNLTKGLRLYDVYKSPGAPTIAVGSQNLSICGPQTVTLMAETDSDNELLWYASANSTTPVATTAYNVGFTTPILNATTTYYVAARKIGCPAISSRTAVTVTFSAVPLAADITLAGQVTASCLGVAVLTPTTVVANSTFNYYTDQNKTTEITTGYSGHAGITYVKDNVNGSLTISGLNAVNTPRTYYVALEVNGTCENAVNTLLAVEVVFPSQAILNTSATLTGCGSVNLRDAILNFDLSGNTVYVFLDSTHTVIPLNDVATITASGTYYIQASVIGIPCASAEAAVVVTVNPLPQLTVNPTSYVVNVGDSVTLQATSNGTVTWFDSNGVALPSTTAGPFAQAGVYTFTAVATNGSCNVSAMVTVVVNNLADCITFRERVYADTQSSGSIITGNVFNDANAIDQNPQTFSTISSGLGALGVGTTWQTLQWNTTVASGTPVTVKLGTEYSGLALIGAISVVATKRDGGGVPQPIGAIQPMTGTLLDLLSGENSFEYTFVPSDLTGPKAFDGVRIIVGSVIGLSQNAKVYEAYYTKVSNPVVCRPGDVEDIFYGIYDLGIGALTGTTSVASPWNSVDNDDATFATMYNGVGVLSASEMTIKFRTPSLATDILKIKLTRPGTALTVAALGGFTAQRYMGDTPVGPLMIAGGAAVALQLINPDEVIFTSNTQSLPFDRVKIRLGGVANVLDFLQVNYVRREATVTIVNGTGTTVEACPGGVVSIAGDNCTSFSWYAAEYGGTALSTGNDYTLPPNLTPGTYTYYVQPVRGGCEVLSRTKVEVTVLPGSPNGSISGILVNSDTDTVFCSATGDVLLSAQLNSVPPVTNPVYYWYSFDGTNQILIAGQNASTLQLTGLAPGTYTYYVGVSSTQFCQSAQPDRASITFTILPFSVANDINANNAQVCLGNNAVLVPSSSLANPVFGWYFSNDYLQPITNGTSAGVTYAINASGQLTISGLTAVNSPYTYYVSMTSDVSCQNIAGTLKAVTVQVNEVLPPTTLDATQDFCQETNPTVASLQVNEAGVIWYDAPSGGNVVASTTLLIDGTIYYAGITDAVNGCSSTSRLAVEVNLNSVQPPTTLDATQEFCQSNNPTIASLQVNETGVTWYDAPSGGNVLVSTTPLVDGMMYYAGITDLVTGCSSATRLAVAVDLNIILPPTTLDATQDFCQSNNPTIASLQINEAGVIWYDAPNGGNVLASGTLLVDGMIYYAGITDAVSGCSSISRLAVEVNLNSVLPPTTLDATQDFCQSGTPTIASLQVNETGVIWYDSPSGGNVLVSTTVLVDDTIYYAGITDPVTGCTSATRLAVEVNLNGVLPPTTLDTTQDFCQSNAPTIASLQVNESGVTWYDAPSGGNVLAPTMPLVDGTIYYAGITDLVTGCSSSSRLAVAANLDNGVTPTTNNSTQSFCESNTPTVASLQVNEPGIIWYDAPSGGNIVSSTTFLVNGATYYASITNGAGCASINRLAITVNFSTGDPATIDDDTNTTCAFEPVTYATQPNMNTYVWTIGAGGQIVSGGGGGDSTVTVNWTQSGPTTVGVTYLNTAVCNAPAAATYDVLVENCVGPGEACLTVFNEFTPNGDGSNDFFNIKCAEDYPNNNLEVYNRYGNLVFKTHSYRNDWKGIANVSGTFSGSMLPTGTYYYIFETGDSAINIAKSGWLFIMR